MTQTAMDRRWTRWAAPLMIAMNLVWGASYLAADIGLRSMTPGGLSAWRFLIASALMFPLLALSRSPLRLRFRDVPIVAAIGIVAVAGSFLLSYKGIQMDSSTDRAVVSPLEPVSLAILGAIFLRERLKGRQWAGIAIACLGAYLLLMRNAEAGGWQGRRAIGQGLMLLSFFTEGMYSIIGKPVLQRVRPLTLTTWAMAFAAAFLFAVMAFRGGVPAPPQGREAWGAMLFLAIPCTVIGYTLWYILLEHLPAGVLGVYIFLQPVMGVALGVRYRNAHISGMLLAGALLIAAGVWLTGSSRAAEPVPDPEPGV